MCSVYTAELFAIVKALQHIKQRTETAFMICTDSLSSLQAISCLYPTDSLVQEVQNVLTSLTLLGTRVVFCWVPGHAGIPGNEMADQAAKQATSKDTIDLNKVPYGDLKAHLKHLVKARWQSDWDNEVDNKLQPIKPSIGP